MTTLDQVDDPTLFDTVTVFADPWTAATGKPFADRFRAACAAVADRHPDGLINPNAVARLMRDDDPDLPVRRFSGMWCVAGGREHGFLDRTDIPVQLDGATSKGNANKRTVYRRWRPGAPRVAPAT